VVLQENQQVTYVMTRSNKQQLRKVWVRLAVLLLLLQLPNA
jgi:hypothetical protein